MSLTEPNRDISALFICKLFSRRFKCPNFYPFDGLLYAQ